MERDPIVREQIKTSLRTGMIFRYIWNKLTLFHVRCIPTTSALHITLLLLMVEIPLAALGRMKPYRERDKLPISTGEAWISEPSTVPD